MVVFYTYMRFKYEKIYHYKIFIVMKMYIKVTS